jgi:acetyl-CoA acetyltransferase
MTRGAVAIAGAAETTQLGVIPSLTPLNLHCDAALNALADCGLGAADIDGVACAGVSPVDVAYQLGIAPTWVDGTTVGGCSFMLHVRHAAAAIECGLCSTVLITHGESGRSQVGGFPGFRRSSLNEQWEMPYGPTGPPTLFTLPALRWMTDFGITEEQLAMVAVVQREWAAHHPRAYGRDPLTVDDVLGSKMIAWPFRKLMCCLVTDGGGALVLTSAERARDLPQPPVYVLGAGESVETPLVSQMGDFTSSRAFRVSGQQAFASAGITADDVDHLMAYDAFAHTPLYALEALGFVGPGESAAFVAERNTAPGGRLPMNTNGGGLSYTHTGMYGMFALQESVRQLRGISPAPVEGVEISVAHGVGGMFAAAGTVVLANRLP